MNPSQTSLAFLLNRYDRAVFDITPFLPTEFHDMTPVLSPERQQQSIHNLQIIFLKIHYFCAKVRSPLKVIQLKLLSIMFDY